MTRSLFLRYLLVPLVTAGVILGLVLAPAVLPTPAARASSARSAVQVCKSLMKNDHIGYNATGDGFFVGVMLGCTAGDTVSCGAKLHWEIYDEDQNFVCGGIPNDKVRPCGATQYEFNWGPIWKYVTPSGNPLPSGYYEFTYSIYRIENGVLVRDNPIYDSEWYYVP